VSQYRTSGSALLLRAVIALMVRVMTAMWRTNGPDCVPLG
jgi:hypothetical protein